MPDRPSEVNDFMGLTEPIATLVHYTQKYILSLEAALAEKERELELAKEALGGALKREDKLEAELPRAVAENEKWMAELTRALVEVRTELGRTSQLYLDSQKALAEEREKRGAAETENQNWRELETGYQQRIESEVTNREAAEADFERAGLRAESAEAEVERLRDELAFEQAASEGKNP